MTSPEPGHPYRHLMSSGTIGSLELRNRILMTPMGDNLAQDDGFVSERQIDYFEARARGGAGMIIVGSVSTAWPVGSYNPNQVAISHDRFIPQLARLAERVHAHGARIAAQLTHGGITAVNDIRDGRPMWVPSFPKPKPPDPLMAMVTPEEEAKRSSHMNAPGAKASLHEMTREDIRTAVASFASAAERAQRAGFDGVELHAGHGYLIANFLSPAMNSRQDEYGGSLENRARLLVETIEAVRNAVSGEFAVWCRLDGIEFFDDDGIRNEDAADAAALAEAAGADAIHVSANGLMGSALTYSEGHTTHHPGHLIPLAAAIKLRVAVPIITVGRIEPEVAEEAIATGKADFVAMGRKLLADPDLPNKLNAARPQDVRPCLYHYNCIGQIFLRESVTCWVNPATGRERELEFEPAGSPRDVIVVGGGPAGLEAARIAALRGHRVRLSEASDRLGGRLALAARTYEPNARMLAWLEGQIAQAGVEVELRRRLGADELAAEADAAIVVATGGHWLPPEIPGADDAKVIAVDALRGFLDGDEKSLGENVVILGGDRAGVGLAQFCVTRGHRVVVLEETDCFATQMGLPGRWRVVHELRSQGVELIAGARASAIDATGVVWSQDGETHHTRADSVLVASGMRSDSSLVDELRRRGADAHAIGDCTGLGFVKGAMESAARLAGAL